MRKKKKKEKMFCDDAKKLRSERARPQAVKEDRIKDCDKQKEAS